MPITDDGVLGFFIQHDADLNNWGYPVVEE